MSNISVNFDLNNTKNPNFHITKIEFANKLISFIASRTGLEVNLEYKDNFEFRHINTANEDYKYASFVENAASWASGERVNDKKWLQSFISVKRSNIDNIKSPIYSAIHLNSLHKSDLDFFNYQKEEFKTLYKDFDCFTFLSLENQEFLTLSLNSLCKELDDVV